MPEGPFRDELVPQPLRELAAPLPASVVLTPLYTKNILLCKSSATKTPRVSAKTFHAAPKPFDTVLAAYGLVKEKLRTVDVSAVSRKSP